MADGGNLVPPSEIRLQQVSGGCRQALSQAVAPPPLI
jgi:hypothetical protein